MYGITLISRPSDWEIIQQKEGKGSVFLNGKFSVHPAALEVGIEHVIPLVRVMSEDDNMAVIPWTNADHFTYNENFQGEFDVTLDIPLLFIAEFCRRETKERTKYESDND